jgi:hypothetical protein
MRWSGEDGWQPVSADTKADRDGRFAVPGRVPGDDYEVRASRCREDPWGTLIDFILSRQSVTVDGDPCEIRIVLPPR